MLISNAERKLLRLNLQFFGEGDGGNGSGGEGGNPDPNKNAGSGNEGGQQNDDIKKIIQSEVDRQMAEERKKSAKLQKELDEAKKAKMNADEAKQYELDQRDKALAEREKALKDEQNRMYAIKALKNVGLDDGSSLSLELIDFVIGEDEKTIETRAKTFSDLVKKLVSAEVEKTFKANGRNPRGSNGGGEGDGKGSSIAEQLGKRAAETNKQAKSVLDYYIGGNN